MFATNITVVTWELHWIRMEDGTLLCDAFLCRLCGEENKNGTNLYVLEENKQDLSQLINKYLPLRVENDGKYPTSICPDCNIQLEATKLFFDLIILGQTKLRDLWYKQQEILSRQQLDVDLRENVNPTSSVGTNTIQLDETGGKFIQISSNGCLFPSDHELGVRIKSLEKPAQKGGHPSDESNRNIEENRLPQNENYELELEDDEFDVDDQRKRRIEVPTTYQAALQGKEMDWIFKDEGDIDGSLLESETKIQPSEVKLENEVTDHMQSSDDEDLGKSAVEEAIINEVKTKPESAITTKNKFKFECEICSGVFLCANRLEIHKSLHNLKCRCNGENCGVEMDSREALELHQEETGHVGITLIESLDCGEIQLIQLNDAINEEENVQEIREEIVKKETTEEQSEQPKEVNENIKNDEEPKITSKIKCQPCRKTFVSEYNYKNHIKTVHENEKSFKCDRCDKTYRYVTSLKSHMLIEHGSRAHKTYECDVCLKIFSQKGHWTAHKRIHTGERPYGCDHCNRRFTTLGQYRAHLRTHTGEKPWQCEYCAKQFLHHGAWKSHIRRHKNEMPYQCQQCMKSFTVNSELTKHKRVHIGKPYTCSLCSKSYAHPSDLSRHKKKHMKVLENENVMKANTSEELDSEGEIRLIQFKGSINEQEIIEKETTEEKTKQPKEVIDNMENDEKSEITSKIVCQHCHKIFLCQYDYKKHVENIHENKKSYKCEQCDKTFRTMITLKRHMHVNKTYECDVCSKIFSQKAHWTVHKRTHTGEKPYGCDHCDKRFTAPSHYKMHLKTHTGEKPWQCEYCTQRFLHQGAWKCHMRRHKNEKPYQCQQCTKSFTTNSELTRHKRTHTGETPYACNLCPRSFKDTSHLTKHKKSHMRKLQNEK
ncbi:hypothetical protein Trydic_g14139 [Trypoxylus dichotomus]